MGGGGGGRSRSSSGEDDGDADWRAAIDSVAATTSFSRSTANGLASTSNGSTSSRKVHPAQNVQLENPKPQLLKHYQVKAQKVLDDILEKTIEVVRDPVHVPDDDPVMDGGGIRLFKHAPPGIIFDHINELQGPKKRPRILPGKGIDEKSTKFRCQLRSVAVDGMDIIAAARDAGQKSLARRQTRDAAAKTAAKREEERVAELKRIRGERWLPSIARDMQIKK
ncbi:unnamed protein product [Ilex paraguariensis]|uniref:Uncharacterized protein n=1 Tax=Ilex paraguariensis TaxID=185542 RepID=A0ABC8TMW7_9AQUA